MDEKTLFAGEEDDIAHANLFQRTRFNGQQIARPYGGQHAVTERRQADLSRGSKDIRRQFALNLVRGLGDLRHGLHESGTSATTAALEWGSDLAAGERHCLKHFFRSERRLTVGLFHCISAVESVLVFINRRMVLLSHRNSRGP